MENKLRTDIQEKLIRSRNEVIQTKSSPMRTMGKLWGMDVFTWINPEPGALLNTLGSFPFKVLWMGGVQEVSTVLSTDDSVLGTLDTVVTYNANIFGLKEDWLGSLVNGAGTSSLVDALYFVDYFKAPKTVMLFTSSGEDAVDLLGEFESYIQLMRS
jgi:hypothetical protein